MKTTKAIKQSIFTKRVLEKMEDINLSEGDKSIFKTELKSFQELLNNLRSTASKKTHYQQLDEWTDIVYGRIRDYLNQHGFINAGAALGLNQPPLADMWWAIYSVKSSIIYSHFLQTEVSDHHSSAYERNEALIKEVDEILKELI